MCEIFIEISIALDTQEIAGFIIMNNNVAWKEYEVIQLTGFFSEFFNVGITHIQKENRLTLFPNAKLPDRTLCDFGKLCEKLHQKLAVEASNFSLEEIAITPVPLKPIALRDIHAKQLIERAAEIAFHARHKQPPRGEDAKFYRKITQLACEYRKSM